MAVQPSAWQYLPYAGCLARRPPVLTHRCVLLCVGMVWCGVQEEEARLIAEEEAKEEAARKAIEEEKARKKAKQKEKVTSIALEKCCVLLR